MEDPSLILRGRRSTQSISVSFCVAGAAVGACPEVRRRLNTMGAGCFAWQMRLEDLSLILRVSCSTRSISVSFCAAAGWRTSVTFCMAGAVLGASQSHFAWQVQQSEHLREVRGSPAVRYDCAAAPTVPCRRQRAFLRPKRTHSCAEKESTMRPSPAHGASTRML